MEHLAERYGKGLFEKHLESYTPKDPLYESYTDKRGRTKRRRRDAPPGLSTRDAKILQSVQRRAHYLDKGFRLCGMRFGWTFVIGIIPFAGDFTDAALNYLLVVKKARQAEIPGWLLQRMLVNNAVSAGVGFVPIVGDVLLASFKANSRNAWLLEEYLRIRGEEFIKAKAARQENAAVVKPGAGLEEGETVKGKKSGTLKSLGSMWRRKAAPAPAPAPLKESAVGPVGASSSTSAPAPGTGAGSTMPGALKA